jgi:hypothetical protein
VEDLEGGMYRAAFARHNGEWSLSRCNF